MMENFMAILINSLHLILQGKGGVGKSYVAALIAQYLNRIGATVICADTDPVNATFTQYKSLNVALINIVENGNILQSRFDPLMASLLDTKEACVIDNGAATFLPLTTYAKNNDLYLAMQEHGKQVYIHSVLFGGSAITDTYAGLMELINKVDENVKIVVWENEREGKIEFEGGHGITSDKSFKEAVKAGKIAGIVKITDRRQDDACVSAVKKMHEKSMTLADVQASTDFDYFEKRRLSKVVNEVFAELDKVNW